MHNAVQANMWSKYNCIFIQIPRTGCGSINHILQQQGGHRPASWLKNKAGETMWSRKLVFAVVRNPFDRYASMIAHFGGESRIPEHARKSQSWYIDEEVNYIIRFEHLNSQWDNVASLLGISAPLPHQNKSQKAPLRS